MHAIDRQSPDTLICPAAKPPRPKRRCAARPGTLPSGAHYVGYVEDGETPEMIMKKFEELDRVMAAGSGQGPLSAGEKPGEPQEDSRSWTEWWLLAVGRGLSLP